MSPSHTTAPVLQYVNQPGIQALHFLRLLKDFTIAISERNAPVSKSESVDVTEGTPSQRGVHCRRVGELTRWAVFIWGSTTPETARAL